MESRSKIIAVKSTIFSPAMVKQLITIRIIAPKGPQQPLGSLDSTHCHEEGHGP